MLPETDTHSRPPGALRTVTALIEAGLLPAAKEAALQEVAAHYAVAITPHMAGLIDPGDPDDPIARQFLPGPVNCIILTTNWRTRSVTPRFHRLKASSIATRIACC